MKYASLYGLKPADKIVESITPLGVAKHFSIYLGSDNNGTEWIAENKKFYGVRLITASEYFKGVTKLARIEKFNGNNNLRRTVVENALKMLGKQYDLINYNCEHFVTEVSTGKAESKQVGIVALGILGLLLFASLSD